MKAIRIHKYGGPDVLQYEDAPRPKPQADEVLIRVHAAGVNPIDWKVREGDTKDFWPHKFPLILGWDLSGVVEDLGEGVSQFKLGDEVYCVPDPTRDGAYAEYIAVRESEIGLKPKSLYHIRAAAVPLAALTAWQALFETAQLQPGQRVLIHAGSGGVGHYAVQLAKWKGAYVFATASSKNQDFLRELGVRAAQLAAQPNGAQLAEIAGIIDAGQLAPVIDRILPLSEVRRAHELSQSGHTVGKIVLRVSNGNGTFERKTATL